MKQFYSKYMNNEIKFDKYTVLGVLFLIAVISGIFGFVYEVIFYYFNFGMKDIYMRGSNFLPFINIYATGSIIIYILTKRLKKNPFLIFLISVIATGILEFVSGYVMYEFFDGFRCWDYNTEILNFGNIGGYVCLRSVLFFGISSLLLMYVIVPMCYYLATILNKKTFIIISYSIFALFLIDDLYNLLIARIFDLKRASDIYKSLGFKYVKFK